MRRHFLLLCVAAVVLPSPGSAQSWWFTRKDNPNDTTIAGEYTDVWVLKVERGDRLRLHFDFAPGQPTAWLVSPRKRRVWSTKLAPDSVDLDAYVREAGWWRVVVRQPEEDGGQRYGIAFQVSGGRAATLGYGPADDAHVLPLFAPDARGSPDSRGAMLEPHQPDTSTAWAAPAESRTWRFAVLLTLALLLALVFFAAWALGEEAAGEGLLFRPLEDDATYRTLSFDGFSFWTIGAAGAAGALAMAWTSETFGGVPVMILALALFAFAAELTLKRPEPVILHALPLLAAGVFINDAAFQPLRPARMFAVSVAGELLVLMVFLFVLVAIAAAMWRGIPEFVENGVHVTVKDGKREEDRIDGQLPRFEWATSVALAAVLVLALSRRQALRAVAGEPVLDGYPVLRAGVHALAWSGTGAGLRLVLWLTITAVAGYLVLLAFRNASYPGFPDRVLDPPARSNPGGMFGAIYVAADGFWAVAAAAGDMVLRTSIFVVRCMGAVAAEALVGVLYYVMRSVVVTVAGLWVLLIAALFFLAGAEIAGLGQAVDRVLEMDAGRIAVLLRVGAIAALLSLAVGAWAFSETALPRFARGTVAVITCSFIASALLVVLATVTGVGDYHLGALTYGCGLLLLASIFFRPDDARVHEEMPSVRGEVGFLLCLGYLVLGLVALVE